MDGFSAWVATPFFQGLAAWGLWFQTRRVLLWSSSSSSHKSFLQVFLQQFHFKPGSCNLSPIRRASSLDRALEFGCFLCCISHSTLVLQEAGILVESVLVLGQGSDYSLLLLLLWGFSSPPAPQPPPLLLLLLRFSCLFFLFLSSSSLFNTILIIHHWSLVTSPVWDPSFRHFSGLLL